MACKPATPAPMITTPAGWIVPAAVIIMGMSRPMRLAAVSTALYPATEAMLESTSIDCARAIRGTMSIEKLVTPAAASFWARAGWASGERIATRIEPFRSNGSSSPEGGWTLSTMSAAATSPRPGTTLAPTWLYVSSETWAAAPAPDWTRTSCWFFLNCRTVSSTAATRVSLADVSLQTPIFIILLPPSNRHFSRN